jgi:hypothetical protein
MTKPHSKRKKPVRETVARFHEISQWDPYAHAKLPNGPRILGYPIYITRDHELIKHFPHKSYVLELHFDARTPGEMKRLFTLFKEKEPELKKHYSGLYGDTPNTALVKVAQRHGGIVEQVSLERDRHIKRRYREWVKAGEFPDTYMKERTQRIIWKFPKGKN